MRISRAYGFTEIEKTSTEQLSSNLFPDPEYFHDLERAEQKLNVALKIISIYDDTPIETCILNSAFYAVARRDPNTLPVNMILTHNLTWRAWNTVTNLRQMMIRTIESLVITVPTVALVDRSTSVSHSDETCKRELSSWVGEAGKAHRQDLLQFLLSLKNTRPSEPICWKCDNGVGQVLQNAEDLFYTALKQDLGFKTYEEDFKSSISRGTVSVDPAMIRDSILFFLTLHALFFFFFFHLYLLGHHPM